MSSSPSSPHDPPAERTTLTALFRTSPGAVRLLVLLVGLEGVALVALGLVQTVQALLWAHVMPLGAILLMALLYFGYGWWLLAGGTALLRGRFWPRALVVVTQAFLVLIAVQSAGLWGWPTTVLLALYGIAVGVLLFGPAVSGHLTTGRQDRGPRP